MWGVRKRVLETGRRERGNSVKLVFVVFGVKWELAVCLRAVSPALTRRALVCFGGKVSISLLKLTLISALALTLPTLGQKSRPRCSLLRAQSLTLKLNDFLFCVSLSSIFFPLSGSFFAIVGLILSLGMFSLAAESATCSMFHYGGIGILFESGLKTGLIKTFI